MNKVIQIANLDETKRKFTNPQCGRVYYAKGISPALNTCGGGRQTTKNFSDMQTKVTTPPQVALRPRTEQPLRRHGGCIRMQVRHEQIPRQPLFQHRHSNTYVKPKTMDSRNKMKFIYKLPRGYYPGGVFRKYAPCVNANAWGDNTFAIWIISNATSSGSPTTAKAISQTTTLSICGRALLPDAPEID